SNTDHITIRKIRNSKQMTLVEIEKKTGIQNGDLSQIERDQYGNPGIMTIAAIARALNVSLDEILGEKPPFRPFSIPLISRAVASPEGAYFTDQGYPVGAGEDYWKIDDPNAFIIRVEGNSMEPTIRDGDMICVTPNKRPVNHDIVLVRLAASGKTFLKRIEVHGEDILLKSDNRDFPTLVHKKQEIDFIYRIEAIIPK
ncbi:MAG: helix-turn-helix domain-containing protein, partial [Candidatus Zixiibacteriota bacterium]